MNLRTDSRIRDTELSCTGVCGNRVGDSRRLGATEQHEVLWFGSSRDTKAIAGHQVALLGTSSHPLAGSPTVYSKRPRCDGWSKETQETWGMSATQRQAYREMRNLDAAIASAKRGR